MAFLRNIALALMAVAIATPASAQNFKPQGEYYHQFEDGHFTSCPGGYMVGIQARTGAWFNAIAALCATYDAAAHQLQPAAPGQMMGFYASSAGRLNEKKCPANQAIEYIAFSEFEQKDIQLGIPGDAFTMLDEIVFRCRAITAQVESVNDPVIGMTSDDPLEIADLNTTKPYPSGPTVNPGFTHKERCVDGRLATGLSVAVPGGFDKPPKAEIDGVNGIGLQCAGQPNPAAGGPFGGSPPVAPPPGPAGPIQVGGGASFPLGPQGGGNQTDVYCPTGQAMAGLQIGGNQGRADGMVPLCVRYAGRVWSGTPMPFGRLGPAAPGSFASCDAPGVVTAVDGDVSSLGGIARLRLRCGAPTSVYFGLPAPSGLETWSHSTITCGPNNVATGIYGWLDANGAIGSFGLHCLPASAFGSASAGGSSAGSSGGGAIGVTLSDFAGTWQITVNTGYSYKMTLFVSGGVIRGSYDSGRANGQVNNGMLSGSTLNMDLSQSAVIVGSGKGTFHFDDPVHLSGTWTMGPYSGTWKAVHL